METTLGNVEPKSSFLFGNVVFVKGEFVDGELISCTIGDTTMTVYITECAWVKVLS